MNHDLLTHGGTPEAAILALAVEHARRAGFTITHWQRGDITVAGEYLVKIRAAALGTASPAVLEALRAAAAHTSVSVTVNTPTAVTETGHQPTAWLGAPGCIVVADAEWGHTSGLTSVLQVFAAALTDGPLPGAPVAAGPRLPGSAATPAGPAAFGAGPGPAGAIGTPPGRLASDAVKTPPAGRPGGPATGQREGG